MSGWRAFRGSLLFKRDNTLDIPHVSFNSLLNLVEMEAPRTPRKDNHGVEVYPCSPTIGTPGRIQDTTEAAPTKDKPVEPVEYLKINLNTNKKVGGKVVVKGLVENTASMVLVKGGPGKLVNFFATTLLDDVSDNLHHLNTFSECAS